MKIFVKYVSIVFLILLAATSLVVLFESSQKEKAVIPLSELVAKINAGEVRQIDVKGESLEIILNNDETILAKKEVGVSVFETLLNVGAEREKLAQTKIEIKEPSGTMVVLSNVLPAILPFALIIFIFWFMFRQAQKGSMQAFSFGKTKARLAGLTNGKKTMFKDVAGLVEAKEEISEVVEFLKDPKKFHKLGARIPRGILLIGTPGTGKTMLAKAVANEANVPFYFVSGSEFVEMFVGVGANRVRDTFEMAKKTAPSIIFIDEIDAVGRHRGAGLGGGHDEREQTLNQILVEMDGFETNDACIVMAATNRPDILDPALLRPGRFDRRVILDDPSMKDREAILKIHTLDKPLAKDVNLKVVAERTPGFSGADLANLVNEGAILAARKNRNDITQENMLQAIEKVMLGPERRSHVFSKKEKEIAAYHEAGHAIVATFLPHTDPVHKVSIISRGRAGGYTLKLPTEDKHLRSRSEFESELAVLLGGYTAEKLVFKELTTGASNDLKVASELARKMVTQYGMSDKLGPVNYKQGEELVFLGKEMAGEKLYSETIAFEIDKEIKRLIVDGMKKAKEVITKKMDTLTKVAKTLIEKETLEQKEYFALVK
ncbi:MAG: cell division protein FtsH [Candidatus Yanofskybacteria bacterium RIFCSPHIGHO2_02_FULL_38_22b]|uniref:ATP-dependent zinc metalloprotease FtsH n=1 Tax=Candidatus Yanofskybacteria bacterium RIFCSPHIGHO2_02_FULL_38_22b TaxID=1802673 RepID=A0A1F8EZL8_9BACT|nr:MAG: cell division protein FtsH [Candidatus Yanofskybacteria bacterium RIFCSPHIGHO2_01_FULL_39_44]OGN06322.1 MAG: cell division protein FtsH [Candidatus Yanofskybacteria bacterium RIFCSPHIGHO2_02_FULL_38_22b]OGN19741.1 MAG: cell division protein FtsH [Candidatus Yanofskybacteria bacterium RIFCSPLOWO2_01_FULL_39_28]